MHQFNGPRMKKLALVAALALSGFLFTGTAVAAPADLPLIPAEQSGPWLGWLPGIGWMPNT